VKVAASTSKPSSQQYGSMAARQFSRKSPSKAKHDRLRSFKRDLSFHAKREERLRLFGYVKLVTGEVISVDEALHRLRLGASEDPNKYGGITSGDVVAWHQPECVHSFQDSVVSCSGRP
jgi:hypothetical protein